MTKHYVRSSKGDRTYIVDDELNTCSCPDFQIRHRTCKHLKGITEVEKVSHPNVYAAIVAAQPEMGGARKTKQGQTGQARYSYATLGDVWDAAEAALEKHGLALLQFVGEFGPSGVPVEKVDKNGNVERTEYGKIALRSILAHESGTSIEHTGEMLVARADPQGVGSAITYLRRYGMAAVLGILQEDDDAQSAMPPRQQYNHPPRPATPPPVQQSARPGPAKPAETYDEPWDEPEVQASARPAPKLTDDQSVYLIDLVRERGLKTSQLGPVLGVELAQDNWRSEVAKWLAAPGQVEIDGARYDRDLAGLVRLAELAVKG